MQILLPASTGIDLSTEEQRGGFLAVLQGASSQAGRAGILHVYKGFQQPCPDQLPRPACSLQETQMSKHFLYPDWLCCQIQQGSCADMGAPCSTSQVLVLTWFKKSHHSHLTRQEELQQTPAGYHYCPKSTDGVKAEKSCRSFSSWHWLLVYWVSCRTPGAQLMRTGPEQ